MVLSPVRAPSHSNNSLRTHPGGLLLYSSTFKSADFHSELTAGPVTCERASERGRGGRVPSSVAEEDKGEGSLLRAHQARCRSSHLPRRLEWESLQEGLDLGQGPAHVLRHPSPCARCWCWCSRESERASPRGVTCCSGVFRRGGKKKLVLKFEVRVESEIVRRMCFKTLYTQRSFFLRNSLTNKGSSRPPLLFPKPGQRDLLVPPTKSERFQL